MIVAVLCICLCGCTKKQEEKVEITFIHGWGSTEADHVAMRQIYRDFEKEHPQIHLNMISMPSSTDVVGKVGDLLTVGEIPDIVFTGGDGRDSIYNFMVQKGYAVNLIPYIKADKEFAENISPFIVEDWLTENGELYTVSDVLLMGGYWYNQKIFEEAGIEKAPGTWEEWYEACEKIEEMNRRMGKNIIPLILDANHVEYLTAAILVNEDAGNSENVEKDGINAYSFSFGNALKQLERISEHAELAGDFNYLDTLSSFNKEKSAVYVNGVWANFMIDTSIPAAYAAFPSEDGKGISTLSACVGYILGETGDEKRVKASVEFLKYMLSEPVAEKILKLTGQVPSNPKIEITEENSSERMKQAVSCVQSAGKIVDAPENLGNLRQKDEYGENVILYLQKRITEKELRKRITNM